MGIKEEAGFKTKLLAVLGLLLIVIGAIGVLSYKKNLELLGRSEKKLNNTTNNTVPSGFDEYGGINESTGSTKTEGANISTTFDIYSNKMSPAYATLSVGDGVEWVNKNDFPVYISFDRTEQEPTLQPDENFEMIFRGITYFQVYKKSNNELIARGKIDVKR
ncbi:MAG: hypothetical protein MUP58_01685 [Candidatus Nanohaloarchaeota archaeon QJJ-9]|nr:hypothetical protein [Candidatus Nanohaloarchaeota archaeon QJJ-9]